MKQQITMNILNTPENQDSLKFIQNWSRMIPTMFFLDICTISHIKDFLYGSIEAKTKAEKFINPLREIDAEHNGISYFPALLEKSSDQNSKFTVEQLIEEVNRDLDALGKFFQKAKIVEKKDFSRNLVQECKKVHPEIDGPIYHKFLLFANELGIHNTVKNDKKLELVEALCSKADKLGMQKHHPIVIAVIGCVYGCLSAKAVIKFKENIEKFNVNNALGDIQVIQRIGRLSQAVEDAAKSGKGKYVRTIFITDDVGLRDFYTIFFVNEVKTTLTDTGSTNEITLTLKSKYIFPDIFDEDGNVKGKSGEEELNDIYKLIGILS